MSLVIKKSLYKIILHLLMCICMCSITITAFAATEYVDGYIRYTVEDGSVTITGYNGRESEVTIPSQIAGIPVNTIGAGAFINSSSVTKVNLPDTIMTIEEGAFGLAQTVVYNSNTDDSVVTDPTQPAEPPTEEPGADAGTEGMQQSGVDAVQQPGIESTQTPAQKTEAPVTQAADNFSGLNKAGSVEEVEVDFADISEQDTSEKIADDSKSDNVKEESIQNNGSANETQMDTEKSGGSIVFFVMIIIMLVAAAAGVFVYRKKGRR